MKIRWRRMSLETRHPFVIARGGGSRFDRVLVEMEHDGVTGLGEAAPSRRYDEDAASVEEALARLAPAAPADPFALEEAMLVARSLAPAARSARAALDMARHDLCARLLDLPLHRFLGLAGRHLPSTSMTIAIGDPEDMLARAREVRAFPALKIKLGWPGDVAFVRRLRGETDQAIRVDANEGWSAEEAIDKVAELHEACSVELVEQPCPSSDLEGLARVTAASPAPVFADESCLDLADLPRVVGAVHGVNMKLAKCGGLREGLALMQAARACGLRVMIGCMVESSVGISAAAHLGGAADLLDLDGNLLLAADPFTGVRCHDGLLTLPEQPGTGARPRDLDRGPGAS